MRWLWIVLGVLLALCVGIIALPNFIRVKYGPMPLRVTKYGCEFKADSQRGQKYTDVTVEEYTFTVEVWGTPEADSVAVLVGGEYFLRSGEDALALLHACSEPCRVELRDDGQPPDVQAGDRQWMGTVALGHRDGRAKSVCVVAHQGKRDLVWPVPPLEVRP